MNFEAFRGDVEPGGLYNCDQIQILVCYILDNVDTPLSIEKIANIIREDGLANYFDIIQAVSDLSDDDNIIKNENNEYIITSNGKLIAKELTGELPFTVKEKALKAANNEILLTKRQKDNKVLIKTDENGYTVSISMLENNTEFMGITLHVSNIQEANKVKENFLNDPTAVYLSNLKLLLGYEHTDIKE